MTSFERGGTTGECHVVCTLLDIDLIVLSIDYDSHGRIYIDIHTPVTETLRDNIAGEACLPLIGDGETVEVGLI